MNCFVWCCMATAHLPPRGASYALTRALPFLGVQHVALHVTGRDHAMLTLRGRLSVTERVAYTARPDGALTVTLGTRVQQALASVRTSLEHVAYHAKDDAAVVVVKPPLIPAQKLVLQRTYELAGA